MRREGPLRTRSSPTRTPSKLAPVHGPLYVDAGVRPGQLRPLPDLPQWTGTTLPACVCGVAGPTRAVRRAVRRAHRHGGLGPARHVPRRIDPPCHGRCDLAPDRRVLLPPGHCPESSLWRIAPNAARIDAALRNARIDRLDAVLAVHTMGRAHPLERLLPASRRAAAGASLRATTWT